MTGINRRGRYGRYLTWVLTLVDFLVLNTVFLLTYLAVPEFCEFRPRTIWLICNITYLPVIYVITHAQTRRTIAMEHVASNALRTVLFHAPLFVSCLFFLDARWVNIQALAVFYSLLFIGLPIWWIASRLLIKAYRKRGGNFSRVVIVGANSTGLNLHRIMSSEVGFGYKILGFFDETPHPDIPEGMYRGVLSDLDEYVATHPVDEIFCALHDDEAKSIQQVMGIAQKHVRQYYYVPQISPTVTRTYNLHALGPMPVLSVGHQPLSRQRNRLMKRAFDLAFSSVALLCSPIIFIPIAVAIKLSSPGPIFFKQRRTGYQGRDFMCYKFRTMRVNDQADTKQATRDDPRKTKVGEFLRKHSLDELPQFINVWLGDMSIVGPRPHMLKHTEQYRELIDKYMVRHYIKPGITGWAQVRGYRGQTEQLWQMEQRVQHDVWYIEHWTFILDMKIIIRTLFNAGQGEQNAF